MSASKYFTVQAGPITTIRFVEAELFDSILVGELGDALIGFVEQEKPEKLVLDFTQVEFCSTSLINTLLRVKKVVTRDHPGQLRLCSMSSHVRDAFEMLNLAGSAFEIHDSLADAQASFEA